MKNEFDYLNDVQIDFSAYEEIELSETERAKMKNVIKNHKKISRNKIIALAACVGAAAIFSQTVFAKDLISNIIKSVSTGHNVFSLTDTSNLSAALPNELKGLIFDKDGNEISEFRADGVYYDKDGNEISDFDAFMKQHFNTGDTITYTAPNGEVIVSFYGDSSESDDPLEHSKKLGYPVIYDINTINTYLNFTAQLPEYLPDGYEFYGASAYGTDYLFVYYKNAETGKYINIDERIITEESAFEVGTDGTLEETEINGNKAIIMDGNSIDWECGDISIGISTKDKGISQEELIKIAQSVK